MAGKPTLRSVAQEAGVSIPTVSQVMRGTGRISEQTREKVLEAAETVSADLVIVGAHKPDFATRVIGPNAARITRYAQTSVLVVRL